LSESNRREINHRLLISTTDRIGPNARQVLDGQEKSVVRYHLNHFESAAIVYPGSSLLALKLGQASAAVAATMGKAKILGLIIDRREVGDAGAFDSLTDEELVARAVKKARELGLAGPREVEDDNKKSH
jgi:Restriction endonuclease